jgi:hypothetical protein
MESAAVPLVTNADMGKGTKKPKYIQEPQHHNDHNNSIQNGLNRSLHGNESVNQPEQNTHDDQNRHYC